MTAPIIPGAEPMSHVGSGDAGVLVIHGFTGNPGSMRGLAEAFVGAGFHVEMPLLAGHGTAIEDMIPTTWADWTADVERAYQRLAARVSRIVVAGLSMGGSLTLWAASRHSDLCGIVCVNPAAFPFDDTMVGAIQGMVDAGTEVMDGIGSDIADPEVTELAYPGTPLRPLMSFQRDGLTPLSKTYSSNDVPLLLFTSTQDHVVPPQQSTDLFAMYKGPKEHVVLERSYHVATQDFDKQEIFEKSVAFARRVTA